MSEYVVIYEQAEDGGWGAYLPDVPGVVAFEVDVVRGRVRVSGDARADDVRSVIDRSRCR